MLLEDLKGLVDLLLELGLSLKHVENIVAIHLEEHTGDLGSVLVVDGHDLGVETLSHGLAGLLLGHLVDDGGKGSLLGVHAGLLVLRGEVVGRGTLVGARARGALGGTAHHVVVHHHGVAAAHATAHVGGHVATHLTEHTLGVHSHHGGREASLGAAELTLATMTITLVHGLSQGDVQRDAAEDEAALEVLDASISGGLVGDGDESELAGDTGLTVAHDADALGLTVAREDLLEVVGGDIGAELLDVQVGVLGELDTLELFLLLALALTLGLGLETGDGQGDVLVAELGDDLTVEVIDGLDSLLVDLEAAESESTLLLLLVGAGIKTTDSDVLGLSVLAHDVTKLGIGDLGAEATDVQVGEVLLLLVAVVGAVVLDGDDLAVNLGAVAVLDSLLAGSDALVVDEGVTHDGSVGLARDAHGSDAAKATEEVLEVGVLATVGEVTNNDVALTGTTGGGITLNSAHTDEGVTKLGGVQLLNAELSILGVAVVDVGVAEGVVGTVVTAHVGRDDCTNLLEVLVELGLPGHGVQISNVNGTLHGV